MRPDSFLAQLKKRRVIRAGIIYLAVLWAVLQAADLFAGAGLATDSAVRWLILLGVAGFPAVLVASWFLESPWRDRRWSAIAGDLVVILAVSAASFLFAWQQWFTAFTRPAVAVLAIEATDTSEDTRDLADHLARRLQMILATRPEIRALDPASSMHAAMADTPLPARAEALGADYLLTGTLSRQQHALRLTLQLYSFAGDLLWAERYEDGIEDLEQLQLAAIADLWDVLPLDAGDLDAARSIVSACDYPLEPARIFALARIGRRGGDPGELVSAMTNRERAGLLHLAQARSYFDRVTTAPGTRKTVLQKLGMQALADAKRVCPTHPEVERLRLVNNRQIEAELSDAGRFMIEYPNAAGLYLKAARRSADAGDERNALAYAREALLLDPLGRRTLCGASKLLEALPDGVDLGAKVMETLRDYHPEPCAAAAGTHGRASVPAVRKH